MLFVIMFVPNMLLPVADEVGVGHQTNSSASNLPGGFGWPCAAR